MKHIATYSGARQLMEYNNGEYYLENICASNENISHDYSSVYFFDANSDITVGDKTCQVEPPSRGNRYDRQEKCEDINDFDYFQSFERMNSRVLMFSRSDQQVSGSAMSMYSEISSNHGSHTLIANQSSTVSGLNGSVTNGSVQPKLGRNYISNKSSLNNDTARINKEEKDVENIETSKVDGGIFSNDTAKFDFAMLEHHDRSDKSVSESQVMTFDRSDKSISESQVMTFDRSDKSVSESQVMTFDRFDKSISESQVMTFDRSDKYVTESQVMTFDRSDTSISESQVMTFDRSDKSISESQVMTFDRSDKSISESQVMTLDKFDKSISESQVRTFDRSDKSISDRQVMTFNIFDKSISESEVMTFDRSDKTISESQVMTLVTGGSEDTENNSHRKHSRVVNGITHNKRATNVNIDSGQQPIKMHENANTETAPFSLKQTTVIGTMENNEEDCESDIKSASRLTNVQKPSIAVESMADPGLETAQNSVCSDFNQVNVKQNFDPAINSNAKELDNNIFSSSKVQQRTNSLISRKEETMISELTSVELTEPAGQTFSSDKSDHIQTLTESKAHRNLPLVENMGRNKYLLHHSRNGNDVVSHKNCKNKHGPANSNAKSSQVESHKPSKTKSFKKVSAVTYQYVEAMRAIDRIRTGPYSAQLNHIASASTCDKNKNGAKANRNKQIKPPSKKGKYQLASVKINSKVKYMDNHNGYDTKLKMTKGRDGSLKSEGGWPVTNKNIKGALKNITDRSNNKRQTDPVLNKRHDKHGDAFTEVKELSVRPVEGELKAQINIDDSRDFQFEPPVASSQEGADCAIVKEITSKACKANVAEIKMSPLENSYISIQNIDSEIERKDLTVSTNWKETEEQKMSPVESIIKEPDQKEEQDTNAEGTQAGNMRPIWSTASSRLLTNKDVIQVILKVSPQECIIKTEEEEECARELTQETEEHVDTNNIVISTSRDADETLSYVSDKPIELLEVAGPSMSQAVVGTILEETSISDDKVTQLNEQVIISDQRQISTSKSLPESISSTPVSVDCADTLGQLGQADSRSPEAAARKSVNIKTLKSTIFNNTFNRVTLALSPTKSSDSTSNSPHHSLDSVSRKSVDYRIRNTTLVILPDMGGEPKSAFSKDESLIRTAIPLLPIRAAVLCLILNCVLPGSGTALSGFLIICCGQTRVPKKDDQILTTMCINVMVGLAQFFTVTFLLVGWFWSIGWGVQMVLLSVERRSEINEQREMKVPPFAMSAFKSAEKLVISRS